MSAVGDVHDRWQRRLDALRTEHGVPGAVLAVSCADEPPLQLASGSANLAADIATTTDTLFQIGSITKVYTAALLMQLVGEGEVRLDLPVVTYLPAFRVADEQVSAQVTLRDLLTHTSGIGGDLFLDTGRGDDAIAKYVAECCDLPQDHPLGATTSYCNSGFAVAGHVVEVVTGLDFDEALRSRLFAPLQLSHSATHADDVLRYRAATGHLGRDNAPTPYWSMPRATAPAGAICARAADVLEFARLFLRDGCSRDGSRVLPAGAAEEMTRLQARPVHGLGPEAGRGLGWGVLDWDGRTVLAHDGGTIGQAAFLRVVPDRDVSVVLLTNGGDARRFSHSVLTEVLHEVAGVRVPPAPTAPAHAPELDLAQFAGDYERVGSRLSLSDKGQQLVGTVTQTGPLAGALGDPTSTLTVVPVDADGRFVARSDEGDAWTAGGFYRAAGDQYLQLDLRSYRKLS